MMKAVPSSPRFKESEQKTQLSMIKESQRIFKYLHRSDLIPSMTGSLRLQLKCRKETRYPGGKELGYIVQVGREQLLRPKFCVFAISL